MVLDLESTLVAPGILWAPLNLATSESLVLWQPKNFLEGNWPKLNIDKVVVDIVQFVKNLQRSHVSTRIFIAISILFFLEFDEFG